MKNRLKRRNADFKSEDVNLHPHLPTRPFVLGFCAFQDNPPSTLQFCLPGNWVSCAALNSHHTRIHMFCMIVWHCLPRCLIICEYILYVQEKSSGLCHIIFGDLKYSHVWITSVYVYSCVLLDPFLCLLIVKVRLYETSVFPVTELTQFCHIRVSLFYNQLWNEHDYWLVFFPMFFFSLFLHLLIFLLRPIIGN